MKKKIALVSTAFVSAAFLAACGDTVENVYQTGLEAYASEDDLPKCNKDHENELAFVKDAGVTLVCVDGDWVATSPESTENVDFSCKTEELKDKSGLKIVCNGDSIGVVLNGEKGDKGDDGVGKAGEDGKDGVGCSIDRQTDSTVTIRCGEKSMTLSLGAGGIVGADTTALDSEKEVTPLDSLAGYSQKGPFLKGSTVYLYELSDGRTLKQTNGNFTSKITRDDGHYKFTARDLVSQYAMLEVDGFYRNEVTGQKSDVPLRLKAITDLHKRNSVNVNILTHLEFDRIYHLVTRGDSTGKKLTMEQAKRQAQKEILKQFHIELDSTTDAEDMDVFGSSDADAALLAVSILLQGDSGTTDLSVLLTEISDDIAEYGEWKNDSAKAAIADWVFSKVLSNFRRNVEGWGLNGDNEICDFENVIEHFIMETYDVKSCGKEDNGKERTVKNKYSKQDGQTFVCLDGKLIVKRTHEYLNPGVEYGEMIDWRERKLYKTVTIDEQTWMAENLDLDYKVDGSTYGTYTNTDNGKTYGRYYTWAAAMDSAGVYSDNSKGCGHGGKTCTIKTPVRGICPEGWHIPTPAEWDILYSAIGSSPYAMQAKGYESWSGATDAYGFSALPAGFHDDNGSFGYVGSSAYFWGAAETNSHYASEWGLVASNAGLGYSNNYCGYSVRCLKD